MRQTHIMNGEDYQAILVERHDGGKVAYLALDSLFEVAWVQDADNALHFTRRCDAELMVRDAPQEWDIRINSHEWPGGTPKGRIVADIDWWEEKA